QAAERTHRPDLLTGGTRRDRPARRFLDEWACVAEAERNAMGEESTRRPECGRAGARGLTASSCGCLVAWTRPRANAVDRGGRPSRSAGSPFLRPVFETYGAPDAWRAVRRAGGQAARRCLRSLIRPSRRERWTERKLKWYSAEMYSHSGVVGALLAGAMAIVGCGDDGGSSAPTASCSGAGCACAAGNTCTCTAGTDCRAECGAASCNIVCETGSKCNANGNAAVDVDCRDTSECKGNGGDRSNVTCDGSSKCELKAGANSTASCSNSANCKFDLGSGSKATCDD